MESRFLARAATAFLAVSYIGGISLLNAQVGVRPLAQRSFSSGKFALYLDKKFVGYLRSADGGDVSADVVTEKSGPGLFPRKHIAGVKYEDMILEVQPGSFKAVDDWIAASLSMNYMRKDGSITMADFNMKAQSSRQFFRALISEVTFPACDGSSKEAAYMTVKLAPESTRLSKASGDAPAPPDNTRTIQKVWLPSNFKLEIDGLDCTRVSKIDAITVKQGITADRSGEMRDIAKQPAKIEFPNLVITVPEFNAQTWRDWLEDFVLKGNAGDANEKKGSLFFLAPNRQDVILRLNFTGLGIFKLESERAAANADKVRELKAHLYVEKIEVAPSTGK